MNLPPELSVLLSNKGVESVHWYNIGAPDSKDMDIMKYAKDNNYIVLTCDLDFSVILSVTKGQKPSIVQLRLQAFNLKEVAELVACTVLFYINDLDNGAILTINAKKSRIRILPL